MPDHDDAAETIEFGESGVLVGKKLREKRWLHAGDFQKFLLTTKNIAANSD